MYKPVKEAFQVIGYLGTYQKLLVVFWLLIAAQVNYFIMGPTFIFMNPLFTCTFTDQLVDQSIACARINQCQIQSSFSIVAEVGLYCDQQDSRDIIQAMSPVGAVLGMIIVNSIADKKGKKIAFFTSQTVGMSGVILWIVGGYTHAVWVLILAQVCVGFSAFSLFILCYLIPAEYCDDKFRQILIVIINYAWSLTSVLIGVLYFYYNMWDDFLIKIVLLPIIVTTCIGFFFVIQGPNFLYGQKRIPQCIESLRLIASYNNKLKQFQAVVNNIQLEDQNNQEKAVAVTYGQIFRNKKYVKTMLILTLLELGANFYYYGTNYALDQIGYSYGTNMIATGLIQFVAFVLLTFIVTKIPRKQGLLVFFGVMIALGIPFVIPQIRNNLLVSFILIGAIRFVMTMQFAMVVMLLVECFPMSVQGLCTGVIESLAVIGSILAPVVINICINAQIYPIIVLTFVIFVTCFLPVLWLDKPKPQVNEQTQPQVKEQAKQSLLDQ